MPAFVVRNLFVAAMVLLIAPPVVALMVVAALAGRPNVPADAMGSTVSAIIEANIGCLPFMAAGVVCLIVALYLNRAKSES
jgi:hypothetical protein